MPSGKVSPVTLGVGSGEEANISHMSYQTRWTKAYTKRGL